jgi:beta-lactamase regulating signal transducer with metallopeptidase domain
MGTFNLLLENLDPLAQLLLQAFFRSLWLGMMIAALAWLLLRVFKRASATTRHAVWLASLLIIAALPFIAIATRRDAQLQNPIAQTNRNTGRYAATPQTTNSLPPVSLSINELIARRAALPPVKPAPSQFVTDTDRASQVDAASRVVTLAESAKVAPVASAIPASSAPVIKKSLWQRASDWLAESRWPLALLSVWLIGCALMIARVAHSYFALFRLRQTLTPATEEQQGRVQYLADLFGIRRGVKLFTAVRVTMPMTAGSIRPIIVVPPDLAATLSENEFDSVVAHELAHIKRWDYLTNLLQRLAQAFLFFHPAVWFIGRQLMIERELACDDWAVKMCEPRRYASCLTRLVEILSDSRPLAAAAGILFGKHVISRRVEMILNRDRNATTAVSKPAVAYAIGLAAMLVAVCSLMSPVIAIPLGQQAKKQKKEVKATTPSPSTSHLTPLPPLPPEALPEIADIADFAPDAPIAPLPPEPELLALEDASLFIQDPPVPPVAPAAPSPVAAQPAPPARPIESLTGAIAAAPVAPLAWGGADNLSIAGWVQDDKSKAPVIPEAEMLSLLTDIVKRDSDPNVRNEALQGIYRLRSDAAINTLIQLYDSVTDPKTKGEIIAYMLRRTGDNSKAIAKLTQIAKTETNEELRNRAIRYLGNVKGDDGANNLIGIYDSLQDAKMKQYVIRSLAANKSGKAVEKLKQIAKNDADPQIRSAAIRSLYSIDGRLYVDTIPPGARIGLLDGDGFKFVTPRAFDFDGKELEFDVKRWAEEQREWQQNWRQNQEKYRELMEKFQFDGLDKLKLEMPKIELRLKELQEKLNDGQDVNLTVPLRNQLRGQIAQLNAQLTSLRSTNAASHPTILETRSLLNSLERKLNRVESTRATTPRAKAAPSADRVAPTPRPAKSSGIGTSASTGSSF